MASLNPCALALHPVGTRCWCVLRPSTLAGKVATGIAGSFRGSIDTSLIPVLMALSWSLIVTSVVDPVV